MAAGDESNVTANIVSTFLLALLLIPKLRSDGRKYTFTPTLTIVTSELRAFVAFNERKEPRIFDHLSDEGKSSMANCYPVSKLLKILALHEIARGHPVKQLGCTLNLVNPDWCHSEVGRGMMNPIVAVVMKIICRSTDVGARTLVDAALCHAMERRPMSNISVTRVLLP